MQSFLEEIHIIIDVAKKQVAVIFYANVGSKTVSKVFQLLLTWQKAGYCNI